MDAVPRATSNQPGILFARRTAGGQRLGSGLQLLKIVGLGDFGDLGGLSFLIDGDDELLDLIAQSPFTSGHFDAHSLKEAGQVP